ncbi:OmpA family protein [Aquisphaera giovannonii]|uniref:OmpA family protein n=1 Tax=Aquisphaera giovannonii TaxID=406548 RepID=A0A5B9VUH4_9BACT|nr:OmpA family protein [Aquisphaera giovannonii]QEH31749.1 OmpA family protein [Aquisphaera giovannonii]
MSGFDKVGRNTGAGKFEAEIAVGPKLVCQYLVYNYNIDGNVLKPEHRDDLDRHVVPLLRDQNVHAELTGTASRSGDSEYNRQLSPGRVLRVKQHLRGKGIPESKLPGPDIRAAGEDLSTSISDEDERDRGVRIRIGMGIKALPIWPTIVVPVIVTADGPKPIDLPPPPPAPDAEGRWTIRQIHGSNASVGFGASVPFAGASVAGSLVEYHFLLVNRKTSQMAQCRFFGPGVSGGVAPADWERLPGAGKVSFGPTGGVSFTMQSKTWNNFSTRKDVDFPSFHGKAVWIEPAGLGLTTSAGVTPRLVLPDVGVTVEVSTGNTIGTPGSTLSAGTFACKEPVPLKLP